MRCNTIIDINVSKLDKIREDAIKTMHSLLTDEEIEDDNINIEIEEHKKDDNLKYNNQATKESKNNIVFDKSKKCDSNSNNKENIIDIALNNMQKEILNLLLKNESVKEVIIREHLLAELVADSINEAFFDEIGDTVLECIADKITLVDDYRKDVERYLED